ncbi:hypothetical protein J8273_1281 [Carpediemonas membranifera]|uniref:Uncharacterized protein n=1 Tax=Carpediemonas membranifera TaxID=201153 RepID=A0A8J6B2E0_9EUKA|nr:hypothetical protein J8273_1281 [Carpediemonas membranifera]|eukprot:KAG9396945.1 hypothetical protein J8273_1281 [Carpediemonas membranifera]
MWRDPDITPLVRDFREAYVGIAAPFQSWLGEYSTATRVWLSRASPGYLTRLRAGLERVRPLLHDRPGVRLDFLDTLGELDTEVAAIAADHGRYHPRIHALPEGQRVGRTGTVAEALVGVLSCVTRMSAAVTKLTAPCSARIPRARELHGALNGYVGIPSRETYFSISLTEIRAPARTSFGAPSMQLQIR